MSQKGNAQEALLTVIGDKNVIRRTEVLNKSFSKILINGPFYCIVTWNNRIQTVDISTHSNIQPYIVVRVEDDTLKLMFQSDGNFKFTEMNIYLNLLPTINEIRLAGITTLYSMNALQLTHPLTLYTQDTSTLILDLDIFSLNALFLSAGSTKLVGQVKNTAIIQYNGIGNVDASQLSCLIVDLKANGLGTISVKGTYRCTIEAEGITTVKYNCPMTNQVQATDLAQVIPV